MTGDDKVKFWNDEAYWWNQPKWWNWLEALDALDRDGDKKPLTDLLRSDCEIPKEVREWLADLIERGVPRSPNRPRTPAYIISDVSLLHLLAMGLVRHLCKQGMSKESVSFGCEKAP